MFSEFLSRSGLLAWPLAALGIFFVTFVVVLVRVILMRDGHASTLAALPLADEAGQDARRSAR